MADIGHDRAPSKRDFDWWAINALASVATLVAVIAGGIWVVAVASAKVDALQNSLTLFESQVITQIGQLRTDLASNTERLDQRVDRLRDGAGAR